MREIHICLEKLINSLLELSKTGQVCLLDSCGVSHLGSHMLVAGIKPTEKLKIVDNVESDLKAFEELTSKHFAAIFTLSYNLGMKLNKIQPRPEKKRLIDEPDIFACFFDCLVIYDYNLSKTFLIGNENKFDDFERSLISQPAPKLEVSEPQSVVSSNFSKIEYLDKISQILELIRCGETYQTNLTQQFAVKLHESHSAQNIYYKLRKRHPAPFSAFIKRDEDFVISASPERFFRAKISADNSLNSIISTSPIKGTRRRGADPEEDKALQNQLLKSEKDLAENIMIVDLLRNDLGRVCKFGTVKVDKLCELEKHPTLFHLVSTISGELNENIGISDILKAVFPCGSITGAPKINTMKIIEQLETVDRGLSMGAIGFSVKNTDAQITEFPLGTIYFDLSVAIRTMVWRENSAYFNVGGGIVIDSQPDDEYAETLVKAKALLQTINGAIV